MKNYGGGTLFNMMVGRYRCRIDIGKLRHGAKCLLDLSPRVQIGDLAIGNRRQYQGWIEQYESVWPRTSLWVLVGLVPTCDHSCGCREVPSGRSSSCGNSRWVDPQTRSIL